MDYDHKVTLRHKFLEACGAETVDIHQPIADLRKTRGHLNPQGLGDAELLSGPPGGQSTVGFETAESYRHAEETGDSGYGGAEYAVVQSPDAERVCEKFAELHGGAGAVILPSGLSAITTVFSAFLNFGSSTILIPENRYFPAERALQAMKKSNSDLEIYYYSAQADEQEIDDTLKDIRRQGRDVGMIYLEAPGSQTFEIPDIKGIIAVAKDEGIRTVMDNTWASHTRFQPLRHGIDIAIQATTKYEGGYADTPSGVVIAGAKADYETLARTTRAFGTGAVAPQTCRRLFGRVASTAERMNKHYTSSLHIMDYLKRHPAIDKILCPALPESPDHERFKTYFKKGNGLFTVVFKDNVPQETVDKFMDNLLLFRIGESWGGHVSLVLPAHPARILSTPPKGPMVRFSIGLEDAEDLLRDLGQALPVLQDFRPAP